jgi:hypothetical protein
LHSIFAISGVSKWISAILDANEKIAFYSCRRRHSSRNPRASLLGIVENHLADRYVLPSPHYVQNAAQEIGENRGILNRVRLSWTRRTESCIVNNGSHFEQLLWLFHFILLLTITVLSLSCFSLRCFLNKSQALFFHHFTNHKWNSKNYNDKKLKTKHNLEWQKNLTF